MFDTVKILSEIHNFDQDHKCSLTINNPIGSPRARPKLRLNFQIGNKLARKSSIVELAAKKKPQKRREEAAERLKRAPREKSGLLARSAMHSGTLYRCVIKHY